MQNPRSEGQIYNIAGDQKITIEALAYRVIERSASQSKPIFIPFADVYGVDAEDPRHRTPSTEKIRRDLGWVPKRSLNILIDELIEDLSIELSSAISID